MIVKCLECGEVFDLPEHLRRLKVVTCLNCSLDSRRRTRTTLDKLCSARDRVRLNALVGDN